MASRSFDLSGFNVRVDGLDADCAAVLDGIWGLFAGDTGRGVIDVRVHFAGPELTEGRIDDAPLRREIRAATVSFEAREGSIEVAANGHCRARVRTGHPAMRAFALINLILPALAWRLPALGALVVHSGAVLIDGRGFLLVGRAGAGKSTFVRQAIAGGARAVSEDLNLIVHDNAAWWLAGSPLRAREAQAVDAAPPAPSRDLPGPGPGRWPLAAVLIPSQGAAAALDPAPQLLVSAQVQASLPYVGDCWMQVTGGRELTEHLDEVPSARLTFAREPSFVDLLRRWPNK